MLIKRRVDIKLLYSRWLSGKKKKSACNAGDAGSIPGQEDPTRRNWQPTPVFLPEKSHGQRSLTGSNPWGRKESDMTEQLSTHATPTIMLYWRHNTYPII